MLGTRECKLYFKLTRYGRDSRFHVLEWWRNHFSPLATCKRVELAVNNRRTPSMVLSWGTVILRMLTYHPKKKRKTEERSYSKDACESGLSLDSSHLRSLILMEFCLNLVNYDWEGKSQEGKSISLAWLMQINKEKRIWWKKRETQFYV